MRYVALALVLALVIPWPAHATLVLRFDAFGAAGGVLSTGTTTIGFSLGQPMVGVARQGMLRESVGFWHSTRWPTAVGDRPTSTAEFPHFSVGPSVPNPFRATTVVSFTVPSSPTAHLGTSLSVYDPSGRLVRFVNLGVLPAGPHSVAWDGRDNEGRPVASGVYLCRLDVGSFQAVRRLTLER